MHTCTYTSSWQDSLGYDALNLERVLEPFRLNVGYIDIGEGQFPFLSCPVLS